MYPLNFANFILSDNLSLNFTKRRNKLTNIAYAKGGPCFRKVNALHSVSVPLNIWPQHFFNPYNIFYQIFFDTPKINLKKLLNSNIFIEPPFVCPQKSLFPKKIFVPPSKCLSQQNCWTLRIFSPHILLPLNK